MVKLRYIDLRGEIDMKTLRKGFTLVELVVVIAIIGVLAAILVPSILTYVEKSRLKAANANAKTAYNAVAEYVTQASIDGKGLSQALSEFTQGDTPNGLNCRVEPSSPADKVIFDALSSNGDAAGTVWVLGAGSGSGHVDVIINGKETFAVQWAQTDKSADLWGQYPDPISWDEYKYNIKGKNKHPGCYRRTWA